MAVSRIRFRPDLKMWCLRRAAAAGLWNGKGSLQGIQSANANNAINRHFNVSAPVAVKQIVTTTQNKEMTVEGLRVSSPREHWLVKPTTDVTVGDRKPCYMCALDLDVKHTDVLILSQFVRSDGCMLPKRITGLCSMQQKKIGVMVQMAHRAGLMLNLTPKGCKRNISNRKNWKKFNTYFDESTIFPGKRKKSFFEEFKTYGSGAVKH
ncbi:mitochondrial ribosomal protein S18A [Arctopsyche grandis]|uniref:mitochondrial ribosomal protein S18A n=1 Tax=Arctopsyche grandis TaxID=121162 RepID=UPI00406D8C0E